MQPKAAGSSVLMKLANAMVLDVLRQMGETACYRHCISSRLGQGFFSQINHIAA